MSSAVLARGISSRASHPRAQQQDQQNPPQQPPQQQPAPNQTAPPHQPPSQQGPPPTPGTPQQAPPEQTPPPPVHIGPVVVIDPGHGGTDTGARGTTLVEKDVVLQVAKILRAELERLGYRAVMTRNDDSNPSYEDRAALVNAYRDAIFVSLHVSSTGVTGDTRAYFYQFPVPFQAADASLSSEPVKQSFRGAIPWEEAQRPFSDQSRRLANLVQIELAHRFPQSPNAPTPAAVRNLRSVAAPAAAVEISSVSVSDPIALTSLSGLLAASVARGIAAFRPATPPVTSQP
ncbi:MAG TPA: N-acetylmuramoyl-L-alanine amidase [Candidatus Dormibacteraeota bacterium]|nr:N-acetylmuramoyl-L-alanine amidase [Candidatus Dormibacteraeota bacterium]